MATGDALTGDNTTIWIEAAGTLGSALASSTNKYQMEVTNFNSGGGAKEEDSVPVHGGGFIDHAKPQSQYDISMDVIIRFGSTSTKWDILNDQGATARMIAIQNTDGTNYYWEAYNNVKTVTFDKEFAADGMWKGTITFKLSPADANGNKNYQYNNNTNGITDATNGLTAW